MAPHASHLQALLTMAPSAFVSGEFGRLPAIRSISDLRKEVQREFGKLSESDLEALVGWFNRNFFRLER